MAEGVRALVVSGFLGSGKTTLVRYLLEAAQRTGVRAAVISNEFGELGIDQALLGDSAEAYVELEGGCVCCQLSDELIDTLQTLWERVRPERIIVETSGVALPYDTQLSFWRPPVSDWVSDDLAVVVVNAEQVESGRDLVGTFEDQVSSADLILLNKIDLVAESALAGIEARLVEWAPETPIVHTTRARVDPLLLFAPDVGHMRPRSDSQTGGGDHDHEAFSAVELRFSAGIEPEDLLDEIRQVGALRAKGFVDTSAGLRLVQGVGPRIELEAVAAPPASDLVGRVVVICRA